MDLQHPQQNQQVTNANKDMDVVAAFALYKSLSDEQKKLFKALIAQEAINKVNTTKMSFDNNQSK
jgi:hypothetical protein